MKKSSIIGLALFSFLLFINTASAYHSSYPRFESNYQLFPSYQNFPKITDRSSFSDFSTSFYNRNYQGGLAERNIRYDEFLEIKKKKIIRTVSHTINERYLGPTETETRNIENKIQNNREFSSIPTNPSAYSGGGYWTGSPRLTPYGYYSWRY